MTPSQTISALRPPARSIESVLASRWARLAIPSLSDLFFLSVLIWLFMSSGAAGWQGLLVDGDVGWHLRTGEYILAHHSVPHHDLYSFSKPGAPWYAWEWLSDVIDGGLDRLAGLKGVVLASGVILALFATTLIRRMMWRNVHLFVALVVSLLGVGAASIHFLARPHIYTLLLLSFSMWILEADRAGDRPARIWWLVPITMVWTNLHGGFLVLIAVLGLTTLGSAIECALDKGSLSQLSKDWTSVEMWRKPIRYATVTVLCALSSLVNPYGYGLHVHVVEYLRSDWIRNVIQEFQSPSFRTENMMQFEALLFLGLVVAGRLIPRRQIAEGLWVLFFAYLSLSSVRHVPVFVTVTVPLIAAELSIWWRDWTSSASKKSILAILNQMAADSASGFKRSSGWPALVVLMLALMGPPIPWPKDFPKEIFPVAMVHAHEAEILESRILTTDQWADYLIYTNPQQKVFVDGRSDFYGPEVGNEYLHLMNGQWDWQQILAKYKFDLALLPVESSLTQLLKQRPDWRVVEDDGKRVLLAPKATPVLPTPKSITEPRF